MTSSTQLQIRHGTGSQCDGATGASSELWHDTTNNRVRANDGSRQGGWPIPNFSDIQKQSFGFATVTGTGNAIILTHQISMLAWVAGLRGQFFVTNANTGAVTVTPDGLASKAGRKMKKGTISDLESGDLPVGAKVDWTYDGTQLIFDVTDWSDNGGGDGELLAVASGGGASYDFIGNISSDFTNYYFVLENLVCGNAFATLQMRLRRAGQSTFDSGSSDYPYMQIAATTTGNPASTKSSGASFVPLAGSSGSSNAYWGGTVQLNNLGVSDYSSFNWQVALINPTFGNKVSLYNGAGYRNSNTALDGVQFLFDAGTIAGSIMMYGQRSSL